MGSADQSTASNSAGDVSQLARGDVDIRCTHPADGAVGVIDKYPLRCVQCQAPQRRGCVGEPAAHGAVIVEVGQQSEQIPGVTAPFDARGPVGAVLDRVEFHRDECRRRSEPSLDPSSVRVIDRDNGHMGRRFEGPRM